MRASTCSLRFSIPWMAFCIRCFASNLKGFVTMPTVRIPMSLAMPAMTGAAPVPVPPPIPQVTNTMSAPFNAFCISSALSSAAFSPISGLAPAPSPFVSFSPICIGLGALHKVRACLSVLTPMNSTPATSSSIMRFTALLPAPPTPTTIILAADSFSGTTISNIIFVPFKVFLLNISCSPYFFK